MQKRGRNKTKGERGKREGKRIGHIITILVIIIAIIALILILLFTRMPALGTNTALIKIENIIITSKGQFIPYAVAYADDIIRDIDNAIANPNIKAIIFEINSPGGSAVASYEIADAIKNARQADKTTVAVIKEQGTSGAYWIASACEHIVAHPLSFTGSIGVLASYLEISGLLEHYNVTYERLVSGKYKDAMSPFRELSDEERAMIQKKIDIVYETFIDEVAQNRNLTKIQVRGLADGMFYIGKEAKNLGLVDELGSKEDAIAYIEAKHDIQARIKEYKKEPSFIERLMSYRILGSFWMGRGIGTSLVDQNLLTSLNPVIPQTQI